MIAKLIGPFSSVEGVPRGGLILEDCLQQYTSQIGPILIVDDVLTTGGSMERLRSKMIKENEGLDYFPDCFVGAVVFARGKCPSWVKAVFQMPECFWGKAMIKEEGYKTKCRCCKIQASSRNDKHVTYYNERSGGFPLCNSCWETLTPKERLPYYREMYDEWKDKNENWKEIEIAVLEGK